MINLTFACIFFVYASVIRHYNEILRSCNALDYHDFINSSITLLTNFPEGRFSSNLNHHTLMTCWLKRCVPCLCSIQRVPGYMAGNRSWWVSGYQCYAILSSEDSSFPQSYNYCWWWGSGTQIRYTSNILRLLIFELLKAFVLIYLL